MLRRMERTVWISLAALVAVTVSLALAGRRRARKGKTPPLETGLLEPSTAWQERIADDEAERFARYAREYIGMQERHRRKEGAGRAVHRKQVFGFRAELEVLSPLPPHAAHGLFARSAGRYPAIVRLSNGAAAKKRDTAPDLRGFAIHVSDVKGPGAMGEGETDSQDFVLLNHASLPFPTVDDFVQFGVKADAGPLSLLPYLVGRYGILGVPGFLSDLVKLVTAPFGGFAHVPFNSVAPLKCGPHAVRVQIVPAASNGAPSRKTREQADELRDRLRSAPLTWEVQLQFYSDVARTPIEDMSVDWATPYVTVARLTAPVRDARDAALAETIEAMTFDTWRHALAEHRPLGNVMRARKVAYVANAKARGARP